jgi:hypothetical protein
MPMSVIRVIRGKKKKPPAETGGLCCEPQFDVSPTALA